MDSDIRRSRPAVEEDEHDTEIDRRRGTVEMHRVEPQAPRDRNETIYMAKPISTAEVRRNST